MYLKQVEMENFKSFGGKLTIPLMEGYLAVTGPNGSGKSNISDAILFVLGPKSSKAIRAGKLTDLIFDGGKSRNKAEFTKVSLVFDNKDRMISWDADEVRLTRHVKISQSNPDDYSSYFYVNDQKSSMTEFDSLLTRARISADGYNLVQQGDVTRIVQMGALERRRVVDAISGIASYDADISKALGEKAEAEANLDRINIIVTELEKQISQLEKEMEDAKKYLAAQNELDIAKNQLLHRQLLTAKSEEESTFSQISATNIRVTELGNERDELTALISKLEEDQKAKEAEIEANIGPEYSKIKNDIEKTKIKLATFKDRIENLQDNSNEQTTLIEEFGETIADNEQDLRTCHASLVEVRENLETANVKLKAVKDENKRISDEMSSKGGEHTELQTRLQTLETDIDLKSVEEYDAQVDAEKQSTRLEVAETQKADLEEEIKNLAFEIKDAEWNYQQVKTELGDAADLSIFTNRITELKQTESRLEKEREELDAAVRRLNTEYTQLAAEKKVSERVNHAGAAVEAILSLRSTGALKGILGTVQELATVEPGYETALAVAAGSKMQAVVVEDDQVAAEGIDHLKKQKLGRVTFLPLTKMMSGKPRAKAIMVLKETNGYAMDLIDFNPKYQNVFWYVFGDTLVVDSMTDARRIMGGVRIVTKQGELVEASGAMVGGTLNTHNVLKFGAASETKLDKISSEFRAANDALEVLDSKLKELRNSIREADNELRTVSSGSIQTQGDLGRLEAQLKALKSNKKEAEGKQTEAEGALKELRSSLKIAEEKRDALTAELQELRDERTSVRARIAEIAPAGLQEKINQIHADIIKFSDEVSDLTAQESTLVVEETGIKAQLDSYIVQVEAFKDKIKSNDEAIAGFDEQISEVQIQLNGLKIIESEMESGIKTLRDERDAITNEIYEQRAAKTTVIEKIDTQKGFVSSLEAALLIVKAKIQEIEEEILESGKEAPENIPSEEELRRTVRACESVLNKMGNINLRAIEDYDAKKSRYDNLVEDTTRLGKQIEELVALTESLNSQKKGLFMKSYDAIHANFKEIYGELSGGGEAYMHLENEDNPFEGGLMINAKPKNGKLLRLESLSGGEKSLTALAFIFAIQEYQPSPFYVLDEVDMFLDSINAEMVAHRVKKSSQKAQFIQVSLRKVTLSSASHLIGVTRQPSGISKVIMQPNLEEVSKYEEEALKNQKETAGE